MKKVDRDIITEVKASFSTGNDCKITKISNTFVIYYIKIAFSNFFSLRKKLLSICGLAFSSFA